MSKLVQGIINLADVLDIKYFNCKYSVVDEESITSKKDCNDIMDNVPKVSVGSTARRSRCGRCDVVYNPESQVCSSCITNYPHCDECSCYLMPETKFCNSCQGLHPVHVNWE